MLDEVGLLFVDVIGFSGEGGGEVRGKIRGEVGTEASLL